MWAGMRRACCIDPDSPGIRGYTPSPMLVDAQGYSLVQLTYRIPNPES